MIGIIESSSLTPPATIPVVGTPLAYYALDETSGSVAVDSMGNYNGTNYGGVQGVTGKFGNAYRYSPGAIYTELLPCSTLIPTLSSSFTINTWLYPTSIGSASISERAVNVFRNVGLSSVVILGTHLSSKSYVYLGGTTYDIGTVNLNEWVMITLTYDGSVGRTYQNGILVGTHTKALNGAGFNTPVQLSKSDAGVFNGRIDTTYFWNTKLTDSEVLELHV